MDSTNPIPSPEVISYTIPDGARAIGLGRTSFFNLLKRGEIRTFRIGSRRFVSRAELVRFVAEREAQASEVAA